MDEQELKDQVNAVVEKIKALVREGSVSRVRLERHGDTLLNLPMPAGVVGAIVFILVFILGHTLNLAINVLGAYVHTNRLQFVEFFGKFYEGGGSAFKPFSTPTKYIKITEDK